MADKAIPDLDEIAANFADDDVLAIADISAGQTKKVPISKLLRDASNVVRQGADPTGVADSTAAFDAASLTGAVFVPDGTYLISTWDIPDNTTVWCESPAVTIKKDTTAGTGLILLRDAVDVRIYANGAKFDGSAASSASHTVSMLGATRCIVQDAWIFGSPGNTKDGVYMGYQTAECYDCAVIGGRIEGAKRNGVSLVAAVHCVVDGVEIFDSGPGDPQLGVDVEANNHNEENRDNIIRNCRVHDNGKGGIGVVFGDNTKIYDNICYNNGTDGIGISPGGKLRNAATRRDNIDVMAVSAFDTANGWITVQGSLDLLPIGLAVSVSPLNGESNPGGLTTSGVIVCEHNGANQIRVGNNVDQGKITSFSGAESGTPTTDITTTDYLLNVFGGAYDGQCGKTVIENNVCYGNTNDGIYCATIDSAVIRGNRCYGNTEYQFHLLSNYRMTFEDNVWYTETPVNFFGANINRCSFAVIENNYGYNCNYAGLRVANSSYSRIKDNIMQNCGAAGASGQPSLYTVEAGAGYILEGNIGRQAESYSNTYGLYTTQIEACHFTDNIFKLAGSNLANSMVISGSDHYFSNNIRYDGTLYGSASYIVTATTAELEDIADAINTSDQKVAGYMVWNTTTNTPVWAEGNAAGDVWNDATATTAHTPV